MFDLIENGSPETDLIDQNFNTLNEYPDSLITNLSFLPAEGSLNSSLHSSFFQNSFTSPLTFNADRFYTPNNSFNPKSSRYNINQQSFINKFKSNEEKKNFFWNNNSSSNKKTSYFFDEVLYMKGIFFSLKYSDFLFNVGKYNQVAQVLKFQESGIFNCNFISNSRNNFTKNNEESEKLNFFNLRKNEFSFKSEVLSNRINKNISSSSRKITGKNNKPECNLCRRYVNRLSFFCVDCCHGGYEFIILFLF